MSGANIRDQNFFLMLSKEEARRAGLTRYFLGRPCKYGHLAERMVSDSHCVDCKRVLAKRKPPPSRKKYVKRRYIENRAERVAKVVGNAKRRRDTDPTFRLVHNLRRRVSHVMRGRAKSGSAIALLGCTPEELRTHLEVQFQPGMSWENRRLWHVDHVRPLASFDMTDPQQMAEACHFSNLQPLWAKDNMSKGAKTDAHCQIGGRPESRGDRKHTQTGSAAV